MSEHKVNDSIFLCKNSEAKIWCFQHAPVAIKLTPERIVNLQENENEKLAETFSCSVCLNLIFKGVSCKNCHNLSCQPCILKSLSTVSDCCLNCGIPEPHFQPLARNLQVMMQSFMIKCKNTDVGCKFVGSYDQIMEHQYLCRECPDCFVKC